MSAHAEVSVLLERDGSSDEGLSRQIYTQLRQGILRGALKAGERLPPSRELAAHLGVARLTVAAAYDWLREEGFVFSRVGSGTFIAPGIEVAGTWPAPDEPKLEGHAERSRPKGVRLSAWARRVAAIPLVIGEGATVARYDLRPGSGAAESFPWSRWRQYVSAEEAARRRAPSFGDLAPFQPERERLDALLGPREARRAIAAWLWRSRAVRCELEQVMIASSVQQVLSLVVRLLVEPGERVVIENPGYVGFHAALVAERARLVATPIDTQGIVTAALPAASEPPKLAVVTPSHQYPTGVTLSMERRLALLRWAREAGAVIAEDDYDGELRLEGQPLEALRGLDERSEVIYMGTFAKAMYPAVRLAYAVLPAWIVELVARARAVSERHPTWHDALAVGRFIEDGELERHLARMRRLYRMRRDALLAAMHAELDGLLTAGPAEAGIHLLGDLRADVADQVVSREAAAHGVAITPLSPLFQGGERQGLLIGFGALPQEDAVRAMRALRQAIEGAVL